MLKKYSLKALEQAINQTLSLDDETPYKLQILEGKVLKLIITPLEVSFFMRFDKKIHLLAQYEGPVDTCISSSPIGLIRLSLLPASKARSLFNEQIQIEGDVAFGQEVKRLFDELNIDWEGHLAHFTGDVLAYQLGSWVRKGLGFKNQVKEAMRANVRDYLQEELQVLPTALELEDFFNEIHTLVLDLERLEAQVNRLKTYETP